MEKLIERMIELGIKIQQIPAPTFSESERAQYVLNQFKNEKDISFELDLVGNVLICLKGSNNNSAPIIVTAHLDTVFPMNTNLRVTRESDRIFGAGVGDNSMGVAGLFGLIWLLSKRNIQLKSDLWLAANVGEEGLGNLKGMHTIVDRFGDLPKAYIILEGMALGHIYNRALGVRRYCVTINTSGGHSWTDYGKPSAVHELAGLASKLTSLTMPPKFRTTLNVGKISGGTSVNTIAAEANFELDLRSENLDALELIVHKVEEITSTVSRPGVEIRSVLIGQRPVGEIPSTHPLVLAAQTCLVDQGIKPILNIGSTDANLPLSRGYPAITIGLSSGGSAHTVHEYFHTEPLKKGLEQLLALVQMIDR
jgi:tripeptide aminopeptidase